MTVAVVAVLAGLAGPASYSVATAATPHSGSIPSAGPSAGGLAGFGGTPPTGASLNGTTRNDTGTGTGASPGGLLDGSTSSTALTELLEADASSYTWVAAAIGSNSAAGYQLATQEPVLAVGGFNGSDPSPTLAQFQAWVGAGKIHYFIAGGGGFGGGGGTGGGTGGGGTGGSRMGSSRAGGSGPAFQITQWVESTFTAKTVDGVTVYDLTSS